MPSPSRGARLENRNRWRALVARYAHSPLSQRAFCLEQKVALSSFVRWRRVFTAELAPSATSARDGFVAVRVRPSSAAAAATPAASLRVTLADGTRIENIDLASVPLVAALVAAL